MSGGLDCDLGVQELENSGTRETEEERRSSAEFRIAPFLSTRVLKLQDVHATMSRQNNKIVSSDFLNPPSPLVRIRISDVSPHSAASDPRTDR